MPPIVSRGEACGSAGLGMLVHETTARLDLRDWLQAQGRADEADEVAARCADQVRALGSVELL
jgi:hypothetical protein